MKKKRRRSRKRRRRKRRRATRILIPTLMPMQRERRTLSLLLPPPLFILHPLLFPYPLLLLRSWPQILPSRIPRARLHLLFPPPLPLLHLPPPPPLLPLLLPLLPVLLPLLSLLQREDGSVVGERLLGMPLLETTKHLIPSLHFKIHLHLPSQTSLDMRTVRSLFNSKREKLNNAPHFRLPPPPQ